MLLNWTKKLLAEHDLKPDKRLGQNFLVNENIVSKIVAAAEIKKTDTVVEVGAGMGAITVELAKQAKKVLAVEKDRDFIPILKEATKDYKNIEIIQGDILKMSSKFQVSGFKLVGNIPYYLTAPLIREFLEGENPPKTITLMVQKEMAQRICARPPSLRSSVSGRAKLPHMSILSVSVQVYSKPKIISYVRRSSFWPRPAVDSAILRITDISKDKEIDFSVFFKIVKAGFSSPRKQLINNLSKGLGFDRGKTEGWLHDAAVSPQRRAETLSVEEWARLSKLSP